MRWFLCALLFSAMFACNPDETSRDALTELKRVYSPDGNKYILFYQYVAEAQDTNTSLIIVVQKDEEVDLRRQSYFSNIDLDTIYWKDKDTIIAVEKYLNYIVKGKSNYKDELYPMNGAFVKIMQVDPIDTTFIKEDLYKQISPDKQLELYVYRYIHPLGKYSVINVALNNAKAQPQKYGNFYVGKSDFDCIQDIRWDSLGDFTIKASRKCYYGFDEYLNKNRPAIKYKLILSEEKGNTFFKHAMDTILTDSGKTQQ